MNTTASAPHTLITPAHSVWYNSDLTRLIFAHASTRTIVRFQKVDRVTRSLSQLYIRLTFTDKIHYHLSRFFSDPEGFRRAQRRTNTLISGSNALQFLDRCVYPEADMDLYTHRGRETELANFLMKDGYEFQPSHFQARSFAAQDAHIYSPDTRPFTIPEASSKNKVNISEDPAVHGTEFDYDENDMSGWGVMLLYTFVKSTMDGERKVQILVAYTTPIDCVLRFHSSTFPLSPKCHIILTLRR
jgi:hypothetical protein